MKVETPATQSFKPHLSLSPHVSLLHHNALSRALLIILSTFLHLLCHTALLPPSLKARVTAPYRLDDQLTWRGSERPEKKREAEEDGDGIDKLPCKPFPNEENDWSHSPSWRSFDSESSTWIQVRIQIMANLRHYITYQSEQANIPCQTIVPILASILSLHPSTGWVHLFLTSRAIVFLLSMINPWTPAIFLLETLRSNLLRLWGRAPLQRQGKGSPTCCMDLSDPD